MNGIDFLADTNFLINVNIGNRLVENFLDYSFATSFITEIELLGAFSINKNQRKSLQELLDDCIILEMNQSIKTLTVNLRQRYKIKIPDAIIAATSISYNLPLVTSDADFKKIKELNLIYIQK